mmetsp:Transcript_19540/g.49051  ORF Transcript_19540/g.49051 Transcript_19540/m.49051 type:complete len:86 (+) Transcript_19540:3363-3620(+)
MWMNVVKTHCSWGRSVAAIEEYNHMESSRITRPTTDPGPAPTLPSVGFLGGMGFDADADWERASSHFRVGCRGTTNNRNSPEATS